MTNRETVRAHEGSVPDRGGLISILEEIQTREGFLSEEALRLVARKTGRSLTDVYGVATFYRAFSLKARGRHLISVCLGTACHVRGGQSVAQEFSRELGIRPGETTPDREFSLETVNCLGACALGPIVVADGRYLSKVHPSQIRQILADCKAGHPPAEDTPAEAPLCVRAECPKCSRALLDGNHLMDGQPAIHLRIRAGQQEGRIVLSSRYGSDTALCEPGVDHGAVLHAFCPHCHAPVVDSHYCGTCDAPMASLAITGGGVLAVCLRWGCGARSLDLS